MKITFKPTNGNRIAVSVPENAAETVLCPSLTCPCDNEPLVVRGHDPSESRDTMTSQASCVRCGQHAGELRVKFDTIFGIEEDERMTNSAWKVY
ncbi:hypothetical protein LCGC14_2575810 [marine sediment metagenome]|uniref:Uncharacterized protein n=1 Tax=marine sediment metagenome TaxID=412755 RepID=A0A0F9B3T4_9ZZZZ